MQMYFFPHLGHSQINNSPFSIFFCSSGSRVTLMDVNMVKSSSVPQFGHVTFFITGLVISLLFLIVIYSFVIRMYFSISLFKRFIDYPNSRLNSHKIAIMVIAAMANLPKQLAAKHPPAIAPPTASSLLPELKCLWLLQ